MNKLRKANDITIINDLIKRGGLGAKCANVTMNHFMDYFLVYLFSENL